MAPAAQLRVQPCSRDFSLEYILETWEGSQEASKLSDVGSTIHTVTKLELGRDQEKQKIQFRDASWGEVQGINLEEN